jgi:hypothetical protein
MNPLLPLGEKGQGIRVCARQRVYKTTPHVTPTHAYDEKSAPDLIALSNILGALPRGDPSPPAPSPPRGEGENVRATSAETGEK